MAKCKCGNSHFWAYQKRIINVRVDMNNQLIRDNGVHEKERPMGPYTCTKCNEEFNELPEE